MRLKVILRACFFCSLAVAGVFQTPAVLKANESLAFEEATPRSIQFESEQAETTESLLLCGHHDACCGKFSTACGTTVDGWFDELTLFAGLDGSKQPQDFGVNANLGANLHFNWAIPVSEQYGIGFQVGHALVATENAVQVFERVGESKARTQNFTTVGLFQRFESGFSWGFVYDFLHIDSYDSFHLAQWRLRGAYDLGCRDQVGVTVNIAERADTGRFGTTDLGLRPISQGSLFWRHHWDSGVQTTSWIGLAEGHGEENVALGDLPARDEVFLMGADILAPLNDHFALYGETNLIMPADTGTVDAFMGIQWYPGGGARSARRTRFSPMLPTAAPTSFSVDLVR